MTTLAWAWGLAWLLAAVFALWPWVGGWLAEIDGGDQRLLALPLAFGLSIGALTLWMALVGFWQLNVWTALAFPAALWAGWRLLLRDEVRDARWRVSNASSARSRLTEWFAGLRRGEASAWVTLAAAALLIVVLGQATYYPFIGDDEISRYAYFARLLVVNGRVTPEVRGYPMLMSLGYAYVFLVAGQLAEQLAKLIPVLFSVATVMATAALGRRWFGPRGGWAAAFMLMATPLYLKWSPDGYIDIPSALYFVLGAYAADVWLERRERKWAALSGALAGLALWTKQAGFALLPAVGLAWVWAVVTDWRANRRAEAIAAVRHGFVALIAAIWIGGWWYARNAYYDGWAGAVPGPGELYTRLAIRTLPQLIPFVGEFGTFGLLASPLYLAGIVWALAGWRQPKVGWLWAWSAPYTLLWWWLFSYDARFLLTVLPFYAIMSGGMMAAARWPHTAAARWAVVGGVAAGAALSAVGAELGGLRQWLAAPTATYAERLVRAKGDMYPTAEFLRDHTPPSASILSMDGRLKYYLIDRRMTINYPRRAAEIESYDYFVVGAWWPSAYAGFGAMDSEAVKIIETKAGLQEVYSNPGGKLTVFRVVKP